MTPEGVGGKLNGLFNMKKFASLIFFLALVFIGNYPVTSVYADEGYCGSFDADPGDPWCVKTSARYCCIDKPINQ